MSRRRPVDEAGCKADDSAAKVSSILGGIGADTMVGIPEAARTYGVPESTLRRRLKRANGRLTEQGRRAFLEKDGKNWVVRLELLRSELRTAEHVDEVESRVEELECRVDEIGARQSALRDTVQAERRRNDGRWKAQEKVNEGLRMALSGIVELRSK